MPLKALDYDTSIYALALINLLSMTLASSFESVSVVLVFPKTGVSSNSLIDLSLY